MKRFWKDDMIQLITDAAEYYQHTPDVAEIEEFCNYNYEKYCKEPDYWTSKRIIRYYINIYGLTDMVKQRKRRTKAEL